jgi:benzoyl-CoA reductase/2-hydroxyglutaryl-CoA dehydratase subunit BcrC/BadD/HgdB
MSDTPAGTPASAPATKRGLERFRMYAEGKRAMITMIEESPDPNPVLLGFFKLMLADDERIVDCIENDKPLLSTWYGNANEICAAMDIQAYCLVDNILHLGPTQEDLDGMDAVPIPADMCGLIKMGAYAVEKGLVPVPTAMIAMLEPCDAQSALHEAWMNTPGWEGVPTFSLDPAYGATGWDYDYFAGELRRMITFLEDHVGRKMDWDRLREVIEATNKQYEAWAEYNECRRAVPCPHPSSFPTSDLCWGLTQHIVAGQPEVVDVITMLAGDAAAKVKAGVAGVPGERIRILWADLVPFWHGPLSEWLASEWQANVVMDFQGYTPYEHIDTSTEDSMLVGLAKRCLNEVPMIRQARGSVDAMIEDITRITKDYTCDCVIFPGHVGHKDQSASVGFLREACRDLKIPLLILTVDNFDPRFTPIEELSRQILEFFEAHGLGEGR